jgi:hypothetical protein
MTVIEPNRAPTPPELRRFGLLFPIFFALIGGLVYPQSPGAAAVLWGIGVVGAALHYLVPSLRRPFYSGWLRLTRPLGWALSHLLLASIYYLVVTPIGLVGRLLGRDDLAQELDPTADSYWIEHDPGSETTRYFRQS